jgi:hypothetical protein
MLTRTHESPPHSSRLAPQCSAATAAATAAASDADAIARADVLPAQQSAASLATSSAPPATATAVFLRMFLYFKKNMLQKWPFLRCGGGRILAGVC